MFHVSQSIIYNHAIPLIFNIPKIRSVIQMENKSNLLTDMRILEWERSARELWLSGIVLSIQANILR